MGILTNALSILMYIMNFKTVNCYVQKVTKPFIILWNDFSLSSAVKKLYFKWRKVFKLLITGYLTLYYSFLKQIGHRIYTCSCMSIGIYMSIYVYLWMCMYECIYMHTLWWFDFQQYVKDVSTFTILFLTMYFCQLNFQCVIYILCQ